jgi:cold-inducible RNA-binding protein
LECEEQRESKAQDEQTEGNEHQPEIVCIETTASNKERGKEDKEGEPKDENGCSQSENAEGAKKNSRCGAKSGQNVLLSESTARTSMGKGMMMPAPGGMASRALGQEEGEVVEEDCHLVREPLLEPFGDTGAALNDERDRWGRRSGEAPAFRPVPSKKQAVDAAGGEEEVPGAVPPNNRVFLPRIPEGATTEVLRKHFGRFGAISDCFIPVYPRSDKPKGFAFITFSNKEQAAAAVAQGEQQITGETCEVLKATPKPDTCYYSNKRGGQRRDDGGGSGGDRSNRCRLVVFRTERPESDTMALTDDARWRNEEALRAYGAQFGRVLDYFAVNIRPTVSRICCIYLYFLETTDY